MEGNRDVGLEELAVQGGEDADVVGAAGRGALFGWRRWVGWWGDRGDKGGLNVVL